jgi:hypothetical protein
VKLIPVDELPQGLLLRRHCALDSGERKSVELSREDGVIRVRCRISADGELASDSVSEIRDARAIGWTELAFGVDVVARTGPREHTEHHRF